MTKFVIREMTENDLQGILSLLQSLQQAETLLHSGRRSWCLADTRAYYNKVLNRMNKGNGKAFVAEFGQELVGLVMGWIENDEADLQVFDDEKRYGYIGEAVVSDYMRHKGIYQKLADAIESYLFAQDVKRIRTCTLGTNTAMQKASAKRGYTPYEIILEKTQVAHG